ncbi:hypothetical protein [Photorhabdus antumapuensis]|uniref:hypothetical protein n=1 Tax=Photorhabdus antumapuensis TaxID=2862867 RepID=UPI001CED5387|nr:hypothetical protein [Photorhabdus antumapuensis]MCA6222184.1 hypothetical protein [Photorhabdus antumapuensis]
MIWVNAQEIIAFHDHILHRNGIHIFNNDNTLENLTIDAAAATSEKALTSWHNIYGILVKNTGSLS